LKNHPATTFKSLKGERRRRRSEEEEEDLIAETPQPPTVAVELGFLFDKGIL
jgi:hypothetical protein